MAQNERDGLEYQHQLEFDKLMEAQKKVDQFTAGKTIYMAGEYGGEWLLRAISMQAREKWAARWSIADNARKIFDRALNNLAATAASKFAGFKPKEEYFAFHSKAEEEQMKAQLSNMETLKIHKIGLLHDKWKKDNNDRPYQVGYIWARDTSEDHPYCRLYRFSLYKNYVGGGKYSEDFEVSVMENDIIIGCP